MATEIKLTEEEYRKVLGRLSFFWRSRRGRTFVAWSDYAEAFMR